VTFLALMAATAAAAQEPTQLGPRGDAWGPRLDSLTAQFASRGVWHGIDLGSPAFYLLADVAVWGRPVTAIGDWGVSLLPWALIVPDPRPGSPGGRLAGRLTLSRALGDDEASAAITAEYYRLPQTARDTSGFELGLHFNDIPFPWVPEVWPTFDVAMLHDFGLFDGTYADVRLKQTVGIQRLALWFEAGSSFSDYGSEWFRLHSFEGGLGAGIDLGGEPGMKAPGAGPWKFTFFASLLKPRERKVVAWASLGLAYIH
jgi:hypothetical protein